MRLAKITLATTATAALIWAGVLVFSSGVAGQKLDFSLPKLQSTQQELKDLNVEYEKLNDQSTELHSSDKEKIEELHKQKQQLEQERQELQKQLQAKADEKARIAQAAQDAINRATLTATVSAAPVYSGSHQDWMAAAGIAESDYPYVEYIINHEGSWRPCVVNGGAIDCSYALNGGTKAYGVCQALPGSKMASAGDDWATNPVTQLKWCTSYAVSRYGSWENAYNAWITKHWW